MNHNLLREYIEEVLTEHPYLIGAFVQGHNCLKLISDLVRAKIQEDLSPKEVAVLAKLIIQSKPLVETHKLGLVREPVDTKFLQETINGGKPCLGNYLHKISETQNHLNALLEKETIEGFCAPTQLRWETIEILPHLKGTLWTDEHLFTLPSVRPTFITFLRKKEGEELPPRDFVLWRVTIVLDTNDTVIQICQEVAVGAP